MSILTNPAAGAPDQASEYISVILGLLGSRNPYKVLEATHDALNALLDGLPEEHIARPEREGKWSIRQVLRHLADSELIWAYRLRMVLAEDRPRLTGCDQDAWAERLGYADSDPFESLTEFTMLRQSNLKLLSKASDTDLERVGVHVERGEESVEHMTRRYAGHDLLHLRQIERIRAAVAG